LIKLGVFLALVLGGFEYKFRKSFKFTEISRDISQKQIDEIEGTTGKQLLLSETNGQLHKWAQGWMANGEKKFVMNQERAKPYFTTPSRNDFKKRNMNLFLIETEQHHITLIFPLDLGIACYTILSITDKKIGKMSHEEVIAECP